MDRKTKSIIVKVTRERVPATSTTAISTCAAWKNVSHTFERCFAQALEKECFEIFANNKHLKGVQGVDTFSRQRHKGGV